MTEQAVSRGHILVHHSAWRHMAMPVHPSFKAPQASSLHENHDDNTELYSGAVIALAKCGYDVQLPATAGFVIGSFPDGTDYNGVLFKGPALHDRALAKGYVKPKHEVVIQGHMKRLLTAISRGNYANVHIAAMPEEATSSVASIIREMCVSRRHYDHFDTSRDPSRHEKKKHLAAVLRSQIASIHSDPDYDANALADIIQNMKDDGKPVFVLCNAPHIASRFALANKARKTPLDLNFVTDCGLFSALKSHALLEPVAGINQNTKVQEVMQTMTAQRQHLLSQAGLEPSEYMPDTIDRGLMEDTKHANPFAASLRGLKEQLDTQSSAARSDVSATEPVTKAKSAAMAAFEAKMKKTMALKRGMPDGRGGVGS